MSLLFRDAEVVDGAEPIEPEQGSRRGTLGRKGSFV